MTPQPIYVMPNFKSTPRLPGLLMSYSELPQIITAFILKISGKMASLVTFITQSFPTPNTRHLFYHLIQPRTHDFLDVALWLTDRLAIGFGALSPHDWQNYKTCQNGNTTLMESGVHCWVIMPSLQVTQHATSCLTIQCSTQTEYHDHFHAPTWLMKLSQRGKNVNKSRHTFVIN